jgi:DNA-binding beta-propeller fold protein YncE
VTRRWLITCAALAAFLLTPSSAFAAYQFQTSWGGAGTGSGLFTNPGLIAVGPDGSVYVADTGNNRVQKFTFDGAFLTAWGAAGTANGQFNAPAAVAAGPDGTVYVTDTGNNRIQRFDANGGFISAWGSAGSLDGQFNSPQGIAAGPDGSVYVADAGNGRVERFLSDGTFFQTFTSGAGGFAQLRGVAVSPSGDVYTVDAGNTRIEHFDQNGTFIGTWGSNGPGDGQFQAPVGVAASAAGVYVADTTQNRVQKFTSTGAFLDALDAGSSGDASLSAPRAVALSAAGVIYVLGGTRMSSYGETTASTLPPPTTGETADAEPVDGTVKIKKPGSDDFEILAAGQQIPIGSIIDVTKGTIDLTTTATETATQTARFYAGVFKLAQAKVANPVTELQLFGSNFKKVCKVKTRRATASAKRPPKKVVRQLWGVGSGKFRTKGKYASASIRGTQWLTQDRCDGTRVKVVTGSVTVRDLVKKKDVVVTAPNAYLAKAPQR